MTVLARAQTTCAIAFIAGAAILTTAASAQQFGTADQAKAMLTKTVSALKADKAKTLDLINKGEGGFLDRDLYPFCFNLSDGKTVALANNNAKQLLGRIRTNKDSTGNLFGPELYAAAQKPEGQITEVSYMFPRPGAGSHQCNALPRRHADKLPEGRAERRTDLNDWPFCMDRPRVASRK